MGQLRLLARVSYFGEYCDNERGDFDVHVVDQRRARPDQDAGLWYA